MDANSGFWQIKLDKESREHTTFKTPFGMYQNCKMPFGTSAAPEFFQRQMNKILGESNGVVSQRAKSCGFRGESPGIVVVVGGNPHGNSWEMFKSGLK